MSAEGSRPIMPEQMGRRPVDIRIIDNPRSYPEGVRLMSIDLPSGEHRMVPVFNARNDAHHELIARHFADRKAGVAFGVGLYGISASVHDPRVERYAGGDQAFFRAKNERSEHDKIPIYIQPKTLLEYMDLDKVHPDFRRFFRTRESREFLWHEGVALHIIGPLKDQDPRIHEVFVTKPETWVAKNAPFDQHQPVPTASFFWWDDPDWTHIANRIESMNPDSIAGISSFNKHGEAPAWTFDDVQRFVKEKEIVPFDFVVTDPIGEEVGVKSSFAQIAVPLEGQDPVWTVYRHGPTDIEKFVAAVNRHFGTDFGFRIVEGAKTAAHANHDESTYLPDLVHEVQQRVRADYIKRHHRHLFHTQRRRMSPAA